MPPYIYTYIRRPIHVSGLLINLSGPTNSLFVCDKYVTSTRKRLNAGYLQKQKHVQNIQFDTTATNITCLWLNARYYLHFDTIVFIKQ